MHVLKPYRALFCFVESVLINFSATESDVLKAVTSILKYAPDSKGGGGRRARL